MAPMIDPTRAMPNAALITAAWSGCFPGGAAEPGVVGLLSGAGHEADAISMLGLARHECGFERPGLSKRQVAPALRVPGQLRLGRQPPGPCLCDPAWHRENAAVSLGR